jgi:hypothetical protein
MSQFKYIHYGHSNFNKDMFYKIKNDSCFTKPIGGLWASRINAKFVWKEWCEREKFRECHKENSFQFKLKDNSRILKIQNAKQLSKLPKNKSDLSTIYVCLDFEKLSKKYDAIEVLISNDNKLYWDLYGWDCDSLLVMNPECIEVINHE